MKILAVGGGSGGHVTPVVAVLRVLKQRETNSDIRFWCDRGFYSHAKATVHHFDDTIPVERIYSGKLRRYNNLSIWRQLLRPDIVLPNIRDSVLIGIGFMQSLVKLVLWRPDVVFTKGGFVCLPVGIAARLLHIPLVIHDSDAHPGLTNRVLARWATSIATGAPLKHYKYPKQKSHYVGIPVSADCHPYSKAEQAACKQQLGFAVDRPLVVVTGGGLGAQRLNNAVVTILQPLLTVANVLLLSGSGQYDELAALVPRGDERFQLHAFLTPLVPAFAAADIVVTRAGATSLLELAAMEKPTIIVPNGYLTGGHQLKNAAVYEEKHAAVVIDEHQLDNDPTILLGQLQSLVRSEHQRDMLARSIGGFAKPHAARDVAAMITAAAKQR